MVYLILLSIIIVAVILYDRFESKKELNRKKEKIRNSLLSPKSSSFNFYLISQYLFVNQRKHFHRLTAQTMLDIDLESVFSFIDRTTSKIGQQYLYDKIIHPQVDIENLKDFNSRVYFFNENSELRERIQLELIRLEDDDAYYISSLLQDQLLEKPKWFILNLISVLFLILLLLLSFKYIFLLIIAIIPIAANIFIHYWNKLNIFQFTKSFPQLSLLITVSANISKMYHNLEDDSLKRSISSLRPIQWKTRLLDFAVPSGIRGEIAIVISYFVELVKAIFLIEVFTLFHLIRKIENKKEDIVNLFNYVGDIDSAISVFGLRAGEVRTCEPEFTDREKHLTVKNIFHPLIKNCVTNNIKVNRKSILITGSNMSGKTSFLRSVMISSILGQTIHTCFADEFISPILKQSSSIRIDDSVLEGKSFYFEEVNIMASLIHEAECDHQNLFILDEVFKGTNTIERIASAKGVLSYLNGGENIVIVATHDIELCSLLEQEYDIYHFPETIVENDLCFDHTLKPGFVKTRNAIRWLEISKYPNQITEEARNISRILDKRNAANRS